MARLSKILHLMAFSLFWMSSAYAQNKNVEVVCGKDSAGTALVVIDMQDYFSTRIGAHNSPDNKKKIDQIISAQIELIKHARKANMPIILVEYDCSVFNSDCGRTTDKLAAAVDDYPGAKFIKKTTDGILDNSNKYREELIRFLKEKQIGTLVITGANGGACVLGSIEGSLNGNCSVLAYSNAIADFNYEEFIYPYVGQYSHVKPNCKDCKFKETNKTEEVLAKIANVENSPNSAPHSKKTRSVK